MLGTAPFLQGCGLEFVANVEMPGYLRVRLSTNESNRQRVEVVNEAAKVINYLQGAVVLAKD